MQTTQPEVDPPQSVWDAQMSPLHTEPSLRRDRLITQVLTLLQSSKQQRWVNLVAGPGWGKSTLMRQLATESQSLGFVYSAVWHPRESSSAIGADPLTHIRGLVLQATARGSKVPFVIFVDDFDWWADPVVSTELTELFRTSPQLRIVTATVTPLQFAPPESLAATVAQIGAAELAFTADELRRLIQDLPPPPPRFLGLLIH